MWKNAGLAHELRYFLSLIAITCGFCPCAGLKCILFKTESWEVSYFHTLKCDKNLMSDFKIVLNICKHFETVPLSLWWARPLVLYTVVESVHAFD